MIEASFLSLDTVIMLYEIDNFYLSQVLHTFLISNMRHTYLFELKENKMSLSQESNKCGVLRLSKNVRQQKKKGIMISKCFWLRNSYRLCWWFYLPYSESCYLVTKTLAGD